MDFKKIEWIFLAVFFAIDAFLLFTIWQTPTLSSTSPTSTENNVIAEMTADNIKFPKLSKLPADGYYLASKNDSLLDDHISQLKNQRVTYDSKTQTLSSQLNDPIEYDSKNLHALNEFLHEKTNVIFGKQYAYSDELSTKNEVVYTQKTSYGQIYDTAGQIRFNVQNGRIVSYTQHYADKPKAVREKRATISQQQAVFNLYTASQLNSASRVEWVTLAYSKLTEVKGSQIYIPTWYIGITDANISNFMVKRVNAFTGTIIQSSSNTNK